MGSFLTNPPTIPNTDIDSWQPLVERDAVSYYGLGKVSLTQWDTGTAIPLIAQGSVIDIDGSLATFIANEAIGGSPADGTVYVKFVVSGSTVTAELTAEAPAWYADKGGWYNASGERYSGHVMNKAGAVYTDKALCQDIGSPGITPPIIPSAGIQTDNAYIRTKVLKGTTTGNSIQVPHGLDGTKILHVVGSVESDTAGTWFVSYGPFVEIQLWNANDVSLLYDSTLGGNAYRIVVTYEA